ncbi:MAG: iron transporter [Clostridia bacterium]|nr:iron transporter [Clostridia bacterium]MBQ4249918.1 iron transporter [Clostridia bacterium]
MNLKKIGAIALAGVMGVALLAGCSNAKQEEEAQQDVQVEEQGAAAAPGEEAGFTEYPIGDEEYDVEYLHIAAVYFQAVTMDPASGLSPEEADIHIEADVSALANDLGFGTGDWVPYLTIDYKVLREDGSEVEGGSGTFMPMAASDGPHYGANIKMPEGAGTYALQLTIHHPNENGYLLHVDEETGVTGRFPADPIVVTFENWEYIPVN